MSYGYGPQYANEEQELSESDCPSDGRLMQHVTSDLTELYRRKHQAVNSRNPAGTYYRTHMPSYYEQTIRPPPTCSCNLLPDPRYGYYKAVPPSSHDGMFRSSTHLPSRSACDEAKTTSAASVKKYPITARTPRYIRHPVPQLCKRPSTLCLPVTCQPDPAVFHRPRKTSTEIQHYRGQEASYAINDYVMRTTAVKRTKDPRPVDSEGDVNSRLNDLENLLTKFDGDDDDIETEQVEITGVNDISKILKPKIPPSVKAKQEKILKLRAVKTNMTETVATASKVNKLEVAKAPEEPFEILMQRLNPEPNKTNQRQCDNTDKKEPSIKTETVEMNRRQSCCFDQKPPLDDTSALELHKSKSYIVSLIDKALSKELGTVPGDKCTRKEFMDMNPKKVVDFVNRHSLPEEMMGVKSVKSAEGGCSMKEGQCVCNTEEPMYLKQLKQLRWSHLRHIQREAKRLADLERFLDSFSEADSPP